MENSKFAFAIAADTPERRTAAHERNKRNRNRLFFLRSFAADISEDEICAEYQHDANYRSFPLRSGAEVNRVYTADAETAEETKALETLIGALKASSSTNTSEKRVGIYFIRNNT